MYFYLLTCFIWRIFIGSSYVFYYMQTFSQGTAERVLGGEVPSGPLYVGLTGLLGIAKFREVL